MEQIDPPDEDAHLGNDGVTYQPYDAADDISGFGLHHRKHGEDSGLGSGADADNGDPLSVPSLVIMELGKVPEETAHWLLEKLRMKRRLGGGDLLVKTVRNEQNEVRGITKGCIHHCNLLCFIYQ